MESKTTLRLETALGKESLRAVTAFAGSAGIAVIAFAGLYGCLINQMTSRRQELSVRMPVPEDH